MTAFARIAAAVALALSATIVLDGPRSLPGLPSGAESPSAAEIPAFNLGTLASEPVMTAIRVRPPFNPLRRALTPGDSVPVPDEATQATGLISQQDPLLHGIFIAGSVRSALISLGDSDRFWLSEGERQSGVVIMSITPTSAEIQQGERRLRLYIDGQDPPGGQHSEGLEL